MNMSDLQTFAGMPDFVSTLKTSVVKAYGNQVAGTRTPMFTFALFDDVRVDYASTSDVSHAAIVWSAYFIALNTDEPSSVDSWNWKNNVINDYHSKTSSAGFRNLVTSQSLQARFPLQSYAAHLHLSPTILTSDIFAYQLIALNLNRTFFADICRSHKKPNHSLNAIKCSIDIRIQRRTSFASASLQLAEPTRSITWCVAFIDVNIMFWPNVFRFWYTRVEWVWVQNRQLWAFVRRSFNAS